MARAAPTLESWLTTDEVAEEFDVHPRAVLRMIRTERLRATKKGWVWLVHRNDLPPSWPPPVV